MLEVREQQRKMRGNARLGSSPGTTDAQRMGDQAGVMTYDDDDRPIFGVTQNDVVYIWGHVLLVPLFFCFVRWARPTTVASAL